MCDRKSIGEEHVPPKCFFPMEEELPNPDALKINPIKVPACYEHNLTKSGHDEILWAKIVSSIDTNPIGQSYIAKRILRAIQQRPRKKHIFFPGFTPIEINGLVVNAFDVELQNIERSLVWMARGVHFYHLQKKAPKTHTIFVTSLIMIPSTETPSEANFEIFENQHLWWKTNSKQILKNIPKQGANQPIFYYQIVPATIGTYIRMVFYEGFIADVVFTEEPYLDNINQNALQTIFPNYSN